MLLPAPVSAPEVSTRVALAPGVAFAPEVVLSAHVFMDSETVVGREPERRVAREVEHEARTAPAPTPAPAEERREDEDEEGNDEEDNNREEEDDEAEDGKEDKDCRAIAGLSLPGFGLSTRLPGSVKFKQRL